MYTLMTLPRELRNYIWDLVFADQLVTTEPLTEYNREACRPCGTQTGHPKSWDEVYLPLLTCKQVCQEAQSILHESFDLHITNWQTVRRIEQAQTVSMRRHVKRLNLTLHLDEDNRMDWISVLSVLESTFPNIQSLNVKNHMRPPTSYENLTDCIFFAAPLTTLSNHIQQTLVFDYILEEVMFMSPFLGIIRCSDALEEHELVIRDLLADDTFKRAAEQKDLNAMTVILLMIARSHEQPWFAKLQRRRMQDLNVQEDVEMHTT